MNRRIADLEVLRDMHDHNVPIHRREGNEAQAIACTEAAKELQDQIDFLQCG